MTKTVKKLTFDQAKSKGERIRAQITRAVVIKDAAQIAFENLKDSPHWEQIADTMGWSKDTDFGDMTC